ncbi:DapH/DapD/GlmU-related protein [Winogradskyella sp.]|uniref:serine O-acetyltransferase n=1 Tax=Winogradskyella sp. TaxID=1883156 RepID=UPI0025E39E4C|nr:DapH/DapD/GlmU-related protein [Winogradskyella sp.]MCT4628399.1 serine acetyltransferase [Winogradskyella sp.]
MEQLSYFIQDVKRSIGRKKLRVFTVLFTRTFWGLFNYRLERCGYRLIGDFYSVIRIVYLPISFLFQIISNIDIHYKADIKGGVLVHHPALGVVVNGVCIIGSNLTLTGGNAIGVNKSCKKGDFVIGNDCNLGANATIIGPVKLGDKIKIGANACVLNSYLDSNVVLVGIPAKPIGNV